MEGGSPDGGEHGRDRAGVCILNPVSGDGRNDDARRLAVLEGYDVRETEREGHSLDLAREAAAGGAERIVAAGGDGTVNEVVRGIDEADALDRVTFGVVPCGTGNNFAGNVGIRNVEHAFEVLQAGRVRTIDVGAARANGDEYLFLNSCIGGLTAEASGETTSEMKSRLGVFAYVLSTLRTMSEFDALPLTIETHSREGTETAWTGDAVFVLVGNARRFPVEGRTQADVEDGTFDVTVVEDVPPTGLLGEAALQRLFGAETENVTRLQASALDVSVTGEDARFSLDGEMVACRNLSLSCRPRTLSLHVGPDYDPDPD